MAGITFAEAPGINDSVFGKSQAPIRMVIEERGESFEQQSMIPVLCDVSSSNSWAEKYTSMTGMDGPQPVGEMGSHPVDGMRESYSKTLEHMVWKNSFSISREIIEDGKLLDLRKRPAAFTAAHYRTKEDFLAALVGGAVREQTSVNIKGKVFDCTTGDNKCLFATDHPSILGKAAQSNKFADVFSNDALAAMECAMQGFTGDNGEILDVAPDTIVIPNIYTLKRDVFEAIGAAKDPDTANNGFNYNFGRWNVIVWPYLNRHITAGTAPWILMDSRYNKEYSGCIWLDRVAFEVTSDIDKDTNANIWRDYSRWSCGFFDWRFAAVGGVSGATQLL